MIYIIYCVTNMKKNPSLNFLEYLIDGIQKSTYKIMGWHFTTAN